MSPRNPVVAGALMLLAGCASYVTPGGPARFTDIEASDAAELAGREPSPDFPATLGAVRVQAPGYESASARGYGEGRYSIVATRELLDEERIQQLAAWPLVEGATTLDAQLLPRRLDSLDELRLAAAKLQVDVLMVFTVDTVFETQDRAVDPGAKLVRGEGRIGSAASALFVDVRTGFVYGRAEAPAQAASLDGAGSPEAIDRRRLETERRAFAALMEDARKTWDGITQGYR